MPEASPKYHFCTRCTRTFDRAYNLRRHLEERKVACTVEGELERRNTDREKQQNFTEVEQSVREQQRKRLHYLRNSEKLRNKSKKNWRRRHGRQGSETVLERQRRMRQMEWRRLIRAVHWAVMDEEEISAKARDLGRIHEMGDIMVPDWAWNMYMEMNRIFERHPGYWDAQGLRWNACAFIFEESDGELDEELRAIYERTNEGDGSEGDDE